MLLLIVAIAAIIGVIVAVSKSIRFLRNEDTKNAKKWGGIALIIVVFYLLISWVVKKVFTNDSSQSVSNLLGNSVNKKRKLKDGEIRKSGKPYSNFDLIVNEKLSRAVNRFTYQIKDGVKAYATSDPDFNADGKIRMGFANQEISFDNDVTLTSDVFGSETPITYTFKKGIIYKAVVSAPLDASIGLGVELPNDRSKPFFMSDKGILNEPKH